MWLLARLFYPSFWCWGFSLSPVPLKPVCVEPDCNTGLFFLVMDRPPAMTMTPRNANSGLVESPGVLRNQGMTCLLTGSISRPMLWTGGWQSWVREGMRCAAGNSFLCKWSVVCVCVCVFWCFGLDFDFKCDKCFISKSQILTSIAPLTRVSW